MLFLFDVGHVIVQADNARTLAHLKEQGIEHPEEFFTNTAIDEFVRGKLSEEEITKKLNAHVGANLIAEQYKTSIGKGIIGVDEEVIGIIQKLQEKHQTAILTDTSIWQEERVAQLIDLTSLGDPVLKSHEIHFKKTDPGCFSYVLSLLKLPPEEILFVDDSPEKIARAQEVGIRTHLFVGAEALEEALRPYL